MDIPIEIFLQKWGPAGLLSIVILAIIFGRLVPKIFYDEVRKQRDEWKTAATEALKQNTSLLQTANATIATLTALKGAAMREED